MGAGTLTDQIRSELQTAKWGPALRVGFRFCLVYFGLYCVATQIIGGLLPIPGLDIPDPSSLWPLRPIISWSATHIFHVTTPLVFTGSGSGDKTVDWVLAFCLLVFSMAATAIWSALDRKRETYVTMHKWFRLILRFALAGQMLAYGFAKAVPLQMPFPYLTRLVEHYGNFSPMGVLWSSIGASPSYEIFAGCAEILGGVLIMLPRTTMLGALVCLADMVQVFMLNMTYDVPVKLFSFHLILVSLFLLAPDFQRILNFFFLDRAAGTSAHPQMFQTLRANRIALAAQVLFGVWLLATNIYGSWQGWRTYGGGSPKSAFYGIWEVDQLSIDGQLRSPLLNDYDRWRRAIFDSPTRMSFQRMDDSFARYGATIDLNKKTLALTKDDDKNWKANFTFQRAVPEQLILEGEMDGHKTRMQLQLFDRNKFLLISRGFHWVQEYPFNR
jgi:uncharacterized membrane protein YphA (DoxX/SURF4 family)